MRRLMILMLAGAAATAALAAGDPRLDASRSITQDFGQQLTGTLEAALAQGGPERAIDVCRLQAPVMAAATSAVHGATVWRTALRLRNPANAPDEEARRVLEQFREQVAEGAGSPEHYVIRDDGSARFMRAIVMQPMCTVCHGADLAEEVEEALDRQYPQDRATGFVPGELRGAFVVDWPRS